MGSEFSGWDDVAKGKKRGMTGSGTRTEMNLEVTEGR